MLRNFKLEENGGISGGLLLLMAVVSGLAVANLYYSQPLLELMRLDMRVSEVQANLITVITQAGYAAGKLCGLTAMTTVPASARASAGAVTVP